MINKLKEDLAKLKELNDAKYNKKELISADTAFLNVFNAIFKNVIKTTETIELGSFKLSEYNMQRVTVHIALRHNGIYQKGYRRWKIGRAHV